MNKNRLCTRGTFHNSVPDKAVMRLHESPCRRGKTVGVNEHAFMQTFLLVSHIAYINSYLIPCHRFPMQSIYNLLSHDHVHEKVADAAPTFITSSYKTVNILWNIIMISTVVCFVHFKPPGCKFGSAQRHKDVANLAPAHHNISFNDIYKICVFNL